MHLDHEAVQRGAKDAVVVVAVDQRWVRGALLGLHAVHNACSRVQGLGPAAG